MEKIRSTYESNPSPERREKTYPIREKLGSEEKRAELRDDRPELIKEARQEISRSAKNAPELEANPSSSPAPSSGYFYGSEKKHNYQNTMRLVRQSLNKREQILSRVVHTRSVEAVTDFATKTVFRPIPLLFAGIIATLITGIIYVLARMRGYGIPGDGWLMVSFGFGYILGLFIDMMRLLLMRNKTKI